MKLSLHIENCYGIKKIKKNFDFDLNNKEKKMYAIYAKNGTMKTSLLNSIKDYYQNNKNPKIKYKNNENYILNIDKNNFEEVISIRSIDNEYIFKNNIINLSQDRNSLDNLEKLEIVNKEILKLIKQKMYEIGLTDKTIKECINYIDKIDENKKIKDISITNEEYKVFLNEYSKKIINNKYFKEKIIDLKAEIDSINNKFKKLFKKDFTIIQLISLISELENINFFSTNHSINLELDLEIKQEIKSKSELFLKLNLDKEIEEITKIIAKETKSNKNQNILLNFILNNIDDIDSGYEDIKNNIFLQDKNIQVYNKNIKEINKIKYKIKKEIDDKRLKYFIRIFNNSFNFPFNVELCKDYELEFIDKKTKNSNKELGIKENLSEGEKRALYLLKVFYEILIINKSKNNLYIIDDIVDSFDSINKNAIINMIREAIFNTKSCFIILTHSYDFFKNISFLNNASNNIIAKKDENEEIEMKPIKYQRNFIKNFKNRITENVIKIALIPFGRNLVEYIENNKSNEYIELTNLLHYTPNIEKKTMKDILNIYTKIFPNEINKEKQENENIKYLDCLKKEAEIIMLENKNELEDLLLLSIYFRITLEKYLIKKLNIKEKELIELYEDRNFKFKPTISLIEKYNEENEIEELFYRINTFTASNIHINSFMIEAIIDMDVETYKSLYEEIKKLNIVY